MKHKAKDGGQPLFRVINIRVFTEHNAGSQLYRYHARKGCGFTADEIEKYLDRAAAQLGERFPSFDYQLVALGQAHFNLVWKGYRNARPGQAAASA
jgi:hypothetical protein